MLDGGPDLPLEGSLLRGDRTAMRLFAKLLWTLVKPGCGTFATPLHCRLGQPSRLQILAASMCSITTVCSTHLELIHAMFPALTSVAELSCYVLWRNDIASRFTDSSLTRQLADSKSELDEILSVEV